MDYEALLKKYITAVVGYDGQEYAQYGVFTDEERKIIETLEGEMMDKIERDLEEELRELSQ